MRATVPLCLAVVCALVCGSAQQVKFNVTTARRRLVAAEGLVTVTKPAKGDKFVRGSNLDIEWKVSPAYKGKWVHLYLMRGNEFFETLVGHTANDGSYSFIPIEFRPYEHYRVVVAYPQGATQEFTYAYSEFFQITEITRPPTPRPTYRPTVRPTPQVTSTSVIKKEEQTLGLEEKKMDTWYTHNKQQAAVLAGGIAGSIVIFSFYGLMNVISGAGPAVEQDRASIMLGEEAVLMGRGGRQGGGATDV